MDPTVQPTDVTEMPQGSPNNYYMVVFVLAVIVVVVAVSLFAVSKFTSSLKNTLNTAINVKQQVYENPFSVEASAYENPFSISPTPAAQNYQNPFQ